MEGIVRHVKTQLKFTFSNGDTYELPLSSETQESLQTYGTKVKLNEKLYTPSNTSIIGQICCNTLSIEIISRDGLLISSNTKSKYYGYMNNTAVVEIWCTLPEENNVKIYMGKYWVDTWENGNSSSNRYEVSINCVDLLNKIKHISLARVSMQRNITFKNYLISVLNKLNSNLPADMQIKYNEDDLIVFNKNYPWEMYYNNIDRDNIETIFNNIAQNSLSYIWVNRNQYIKTDCLIDDKATESIATLSGSQNIFSYEITNGDIYQYSGVKVNYIDNVSYTDGVVLQMNKLPLTRGSNSISTNLNSDKVVNIHHIEIVINDNTSGNAICTNFFNYKNNIEMDIQSSVASSDSSLTVYGTNITENYSSNTKYKNNNNQSSVLEVDNYILRKECIQDYVNGIINLISLNNGQIVVEGYINPQIQLDDMVTMVGSSLNINGQYKVIGLDYTLGNNYRCRATLLRTVA